MALGSPRQVFERFKFRLSIDGLDLAAFQRCSELAVEVANVTYWEGGSVIPIKAPGRMTFTDITLEHGVSDSLAFYDWMRQVADAFRAVGEGTGGRGGGLISPTFKKDVRLFQLNRDNTVGYIWGLYNAFPLRFSAGEWDNTADEVTIESLVLTYDAFERL